jgi:TolB protein
VSALLRTIATAGVVMVLLVLAASAADAGAPEGPRIAFTEERLEPRQSHLRTAASDGTDIRPLGNPRSVARAELITELPLAWSADGSRLAIAGYHAGSIRIYLVSVAGGGVRLVPGSAGAFLPVLSPDGRTLAFSVSRPEIGSLRASGSRDDVAGISIWTIDLVTGKKRQLTPWREELSYFASSFSPDGSTLAVTRVDERRSGEPEVVTLDLATGRTSLILRKSALPVYSPDGSELALLRQQKRAVRRHGTLREVEESTDLYVANADGSGLRRLTRTPSSVELWPSWDPSGERLAYSEVPSESARERPSSIMQINGDGTCRSTLLGDPDANLYGAAWRPGPGREAGRIAC